MAKNPVHHARMKHVDIRYHFIREIVGRGDVNLKFASTDCIIADILTKNLPKEKHNKFVKMLKLV